MPRLSDDISPVHLERAEWWIHFIQWNGKPGRCGPYIKIQAEHNMRVTHWRPDSKPRLKRGGADH